MREKRYLAFITMRKRNISAPQDSKICAPSEAKFFQTGISSAYMEIDNFISMI